MFVNLENKRSECKRFVKNGCLEEISKPKYFVNEFNYRNTVNINICHWENMRSEFNLENDACDFFRLKSLNELFLFKNQSCDHSDSLTSTVCPPRSA